MAAMCNTQPAVMYHMAGGVMHTAVRMRHTVAL